MIPNSMNTVSFFKYHFFKKERENKNSIFFFFFHKNTSKTEILFRSSTIQFVRDWMNKILIPFKLASQINSQIQYHTSELYFDILIF